MIPQGFNLPELQSSRLVLLDEHVFLNAHHPVAYTLFIHGCLLIGKKIFHSYNIGLFLVSITQLLYAAAVISHMISRMLSVGVNRKVCIGVLLYFSLSPRIAAYMFLISKDVIYAYTILLLVVEIAYFLYQTKGADESGREVSKAATFRPKRTTLFIMVLSCIAVFFRNEGKYVVAIWFVLLSFREKKSRKLIAPALLVAIAAVCFVNQVVLPYYKITPGSKREMLSIPFQQTARYVATCPEEVTEEEKEVIDRVLDYDTLAERYVPTKSDSVKNGWNKYSTNEDLKKYFSVWFQMLKKHPMLYIEATVNNYYNYVYPGKASTLNYSYEWSETCMEETNALSESVGLDLHYPTFLKHARNEYENLREAVFNLPVLNAFKCTAVYVWILLFLTAFLLWKKNTTVLTIAVLPMLESLGIALLGPCNGEYFRYAYIITVLLPAAIVMGLSNRSVFEPQLHPTAIN